MASAVRQTQSDRVFDALGNGMRREILRRLGAQPLSVHELAAALPVSRPAISKHLKLLEAAALVEHDAVGRENHYRLNAQGAAIARQWLDAFWDAALPRFAMVAENLNDGDPS